MFMHVRHTRIYQNHRLSDKCRPTTINLKHNQSLTQVIHNSVKQRCPKIFYHFPIF